MAANINIERIPAQHLTVSVARLLGVRPRDISDLFYRRVLRDDLCPIVGGRRLIPPSYVSVIAAALRRAGLVLGKANEGGGA